jgi:hypothetical protein
MHILSTMGQHKNPCLKVVNIVLLIVIVLLIGFICDRLGLECRLPTHQSPAVVRDVASEKEAQFTECQFLKLVSSNKKISPFQSKQLKFCTYPLSITFYENATIQTYFEQLEVKNFINFLRLCLNIKTSKCRNYYLIEDNNARYGNFYIFYDDKWIPSYGEVFNLTLKREDLYNIYFALTQKNA